MGPRAVHSREGLCPLRDLADGPAETLSIWQSQQSCKAPRDWRKRNKASGISYCTLSILKADLLESGSGFKLKKVDLTWIWEEDLACEGFDTPVQVVQGSCALPHFSVQIRPLFWMFCEHAGYLMP